MRGGFSRLHFTMLTYCVTKMITCSPMIGHCFDTMIIVWSDKELL